MQLFHCLFITRFWLHRHINLFDCASTGRHGRLAMSLAPLSFLCLRKTRGGAFNTKRIFILKINTFKACLLPFHSVLYVNDFCQRDFPRTHTLSTELSSLVGFDEEKIGLCGKSG